MALLSRYLTRSILASSNWFRGDTKAAINNLAPTAIKEYKQENSPAKQLSLAPLAQSTGSEGRYPPSSAPARAALRFRMTGSSCLIFSCLVRTTARDARRAMFSPQNRLSGTRLVPHHTRPLGLGH